jgi:hypothetical protein
MFEGNRVEATVTAVEKVPLERRRLGKWEAKFNWKLTMSCGHSFTIPGNSPTAVGHTGPCPRCNGIAP